MKLDPVQRQVLEALALTMADRKIGINLAELSAALGVPEPTLAKHMGPLLVDAKYVAELLPFSTSDRDGPGRFRIAVDGMMVLLAAGRKRSSRREMVIGLRDLAAEIKPKIVMGDADSCDLSPYDRGVQVGMNTAANLIARGEV